MARLILQAKVDSSCGINAIGLVSIINSVQIHGQNIGFGVVVIELRSQHHLFQLAHNSRCIANDQVFNELLADGAAAFDQKSLSSVATVALPATAAIWSNVTVVWTPSSVNWSSSTPLLS